MGRKNGESSSSGGGGLKRLMEDGGVSLNRARKEEKKDRDPKRRGRGDVQKGGSRGGGTFGRKVKKEGNWRGRKRLILKKRETGTERAEI